MKCYKLDHIGESDCEHAEARIERNAMCCTHPCVIMAEEARRKAEEEKRSAEAKLAKYRKAILPFLDNCRAVVAAVDAEKEGGAE